MAGRRKEAEWKNRARGAAGESLLVSAARLYYQRDKPQTEIAKELGIAQGTVSRLLERARKSGMVRVEIMLPRLDQMEEEIRQRLSGTIVTDVHLVPSGIGKNVENLGARGADLVLDAIRDAPGRSVRITMSCGHTIRAVAQRIIDRVNDGHARALKDKELHLYPVALYPEHRVNLLYPCALVTTLTVMLRSDLAPGEDGGINVDAYAPSLPPRFYHLPERDRELFLDQSQIGTVVEEASAADIFVLGIGLVNDPAYKEILKKLDVKKKVDSYPGELVYIPFQADGTEHSEVSRKILGLKLEQLRRIARAGRRRVIAIAGGEAKAEAIVAALGNPCFNTLVTDEAVASKVLRDL